MKIANLQPLTWIENSIKRDRMSQDEWDGLDQEIKKHVSRDLLVIYDWRKDLPANWIELARREPTELVLAQPAKTL